MRRIDWILTLERIETDMEIAANNHKHQFRVTFPQVELYGSENSPEDVLYDKARAALHGIENVVDS